MNIIPCTQGSHEWFEARIGKVTASKVCDAVAFLKRGDKKGGDTAARTAYKTALVSEMLTGTPSDSFVSAYMELGTMLEPEARTAYELKHDLLVDQVGFVVHPTIERAGASPDGLVGADGGLEIKCPKTETHLGYMLAGKLPPDYEPQVMWNLACTGRKFWDFISYDDRLPERHRMFEFRVLRDEARIAELEAGVIQFLAEVDEMIAKLNELNPEIAPAKKKPSTSAPIGDGTELTDEDVAHWFTEAK